MLKFPLAQKGQVVISFALVLACCGTLILLMVLDLIALSVAYSRADDSALLAAQAGASAVCANDINGVTPAGCAGHTIQDARPNTPIYLDPTEAFNRCQQVAQSGGSGFVSATCKLNNNNTAISVVVTWKTNLPIAYLGPATVSNTYVRYGRPAFGDCYTGFYNYVVGLPRCP